MVTKTFDEIIQSFLTFLVRRNDLIDIKPTAITRTLLDSLANELAVVNNEIENVRQIQTVLNADIMTVEDLDNLAANFGVTRKGATFATVEVTFFLTREPRQDITIPQGTIVTTATDPTLATSVQFATTEQVTLFADRINSYFNPSTGFFELNASAKSLIPGSAGNISANSLTRTSNTTPGFDMVLSTNRSSGTGGQDVESNTDLAARIFVSISGINVGTKDGYKSSALAVPGVLDALVVGAGDLMMVRDFNSLGQHIGGRVDVYVQGQDAQAAQDRITFALQQKLGQTISLIEGSTLEFDVPDPDLEQFPLVSVDRVYTVIDNPLFKFEDQLKPVDPTLSNEIFVTIVSPLGGSTVDGGIDVLVRAFKPNGNITRVNLIINKESKNQMFFDSNRGFYKFTLSTAQFPDGVIQLEAEAFDEIEKRAITNPVLVNVKNLEDISVRILSPDAGSTITGAATVQVFAFSTNGIAPRGVEIRYNAGRWVTMNLGSVSTRFSFPLVATNFLSGPVKIEVRAKDNNQRTVFSVPRYVIVENGPADRVTSNQVLTMSLRAIGSTTDSIISRDVVGRSGSSSSSSSSSTINEMTAGGNFNIARLLNAADRKFSKDDIEHKTILNDKQTVISVNKHFFDTAGEWVGTDIGFYFSDDNAKTFRTQINSANTIGLTEKDDKVNTIDKEQNMFLYVGTNGGVLKTQDRSTYHKVPIPSDKPVTAFGFMALP